jgi:hypothetical protein
VNAPTRLLLATLLVRAEIAPALAALAREVGLALQRLLRSGPPANRHTRPVSRILH